MILKPIHKRLLGALRCNSAATAIEFAIVAPLLFLLLIGIIELGMIFFTYSVLEGATDIGSRLGKTGFFTGTGPTARQDYIIQRIKTMSGGFINTANLSIQITSYSTFSEIGTAGEGSAGPGGGNAIVVYRVSYPWTLFTPLMSNLLGDKDANGRNTGTINISAVATVRNEPF